MEKLVSITLIDHQGFWEHQKNFRHVSLSSSAQRFDLSRRRTELIDIWDAGFCREIFYWTPGLSSWMDLIFE